MQSATEKMFGIIHFLNILIQRLYKMTHIRGVFVFKL